MTDKDLLRRAVDTLQRVYGVVIALGIGEGLRRTVLDPASGDFKVVGNAVPLLLAHFFTVVPFVHGMNMHLDGAATRAKSRKDFAFLIFDFGVFLFHSALFFLLAIFVGNVQNFVGLLIGIFVLDVLWAFLIFIVRYKAADLDGIVSWLRLGQISRVGEGKGSVAVWAGINLVAVLGLMIIENEISDLKAVAIMVCLLCLVRSIADYGFCHPFYFPSKPPPEKAEEETPERQGKVTKQVGPIQSIKFESGYDPLASPAFKEFLADFKLPDESLPKPKLEDIFKKGPLMGSGSRFVSDPRPKPKTDGTPQGGDDVED